MIDDPLRALETDLGLGSGAIKMTDRLGFCDWWDSLNHIVVLMCVAAYAGTDIDADMAENLTTIESIVFFLKSTPIGEES